MIVSLSPYHSKEIAKLHIKSLGGDFLPSLGYNFLSILYEGIISQPDVFCFGYKKKQRIVGFVIGCNNFNNIFLPVLKAKFLPLLFHLSIQLCKNPFLLGKILETFLYPQKDNGVEAELVVIAVRDDEQGQGIGGKLTKKLEESFVKKNIFRYKVTVHKNKDAVFFYEHLKFKKISEFKLYKKIWCLYGKNIVKIPRDFIK